jgi:hypothetical protein
MKRFQRNLLATAFVTVATGAQAAPTASNGSTDQLVGDWRGRSLCVTTTRPACTDETVLYRISKDKSGGNAFHLEASKLVQGKFESMGDAMACNFEATRQQLLCPMGNGQWQLRWDGQKLFGGLLLDGALFRVVQVDKTKP